MMLTPEDVKKIEKVGDSDKGEILHVLTKGGLNLIVQKTQGGALNILGQGSHRSFAIHQATQVHKNIAWNDSLMKSEDMQAVMKMEKQELLVKQEQKRDSLGNPVYDSSPQNHYDLASHHSKMAGRALQEVKALEASNPSGFDPKTHDARMRNLMHTDIALRHYEMSGLGLKDSNLEHKKHMDLHHELKSDNPPFQDYALQLAWNRNNPTKPKPHGLGNWSQ